MDAHTTTFSPSKQAQLLVAAAAASSHLSSSASSDAHPVTAPLAHSPLGFGLLVTSIPTSVDDNGGGGSGGGIAQSLIDSFCRYATIGGSGLAALGADEGEGGAPKPFVLIGEGEVRRSGVVTAMMMHALIRKTNHISAHIITHTLTNAQPLPAQRSVRVAASEKGQADLHVQLIAVAGEGESTVVHPVEALVVAAPAEEEGEEEVGLYMVWGLRVFVDVVLVLAKTANTRSSYILPDATTDSSWSSRCG